MLGYLNPDYFLGGRMQLDRAAAEQAIALAVAEPLGLDLLDAANGIYQVVNENMISATRVHIAEQGVDPRDLKLIAFGGAGPVHAYAIARALKMPGYICPAGAGVASALGFLTAPIAFEYARTYMTEITPQTLGEMESIYAELEAEGRQQLSEAGIDPTDISFTRRADLRHVGQGHEIGVTLPYDSLSNVDPDQELRPYFYSCYEKIYGYAHRHLGLEVATCRLTASGPRPTITLQTGTLQIEQNLGQTPADAAIKGRRPVYFAELNAAVETAVYDRYRLPVGAKFDGPAIVEERDSTAVVGPDATATIDVYGNLVVTLEAD